MPPQFIISSPLRLSKYFKESITIRTTVHRYNLSANYWLLALIAKQKIHLLDIGMQP